MKPWTAAPMLGFAILAVLQTSAQAAQSAIAAPMHNVKNCKAIDGDTLRCGSVRVRLVGIDAAELPGHCRTGRTCAEGDPYKQRVALAELAANPLTIVPLKLDKYQRIIARIRNTDGQDLSCAMLAAGATYRPDWDEGKIIARTCPSQAKGNRARSE